MMMLSLPGSLYSNTSNDATPRDDEQAQLCFQFSCSRLLQGIFGSLLLSRDRLLCLYAVVHVIARRVLARLYKVLQLHLATHS
jgi:hypothetical protein